MMLLLVVGMVVIKETSLDMIVRVADLPSLNVVSRSLAVSTNAALFPLKL